jgi:hypothetical protein
MRLFKIVTLFVFLLLATNIELAEGMRCGNKLVNLGDTKAEIFLKCGKPFTREFIGKETVHQIFYDSIISSTEIIERWTYNMGYGQFLRILTFAGDRLIKIELGDKP